MKFKVGQSVYIPHLGGEGTIIYYDPESNTYDIDIGRHVCDCEYCYHIRDIRSFEEDELVCA